MPTIDGTENADTLTGTASGDTINGFGGDDLLIAGGTGSRLRGGVGNDTLDSGNFSEGKFTGGQGDDTYIISWDAKSFQYIPYLTINPSEYESDLPGNDTLDLSNVVNSLSQVTFVGSGNTLKLFLFDEDGKFNGSVTVFLQYFSTDSFNVETLVIGNNSYDLTQEKSGYELNSVLTYGVSSGDDVVTTRFGYEWLYGKAGNDSLTAGGDENKLYGEDGDDTLSTGDNNTVDMYGGSGNDTYVIGWENASASNFHTVTITDNNITLNPGTDTLDLSNVTDSMNNVSFSDLISNGQPTGTLVISVHDEGDNLVGTIYVRSQFISPYGPGEYDTRIETLIVAGKSYDLSFASNATEINSRYTIVNSNAADTIDGGNEPDQLYGRGGNDLLRGGDGDDFLRGDAGDDISFGDNGNDALWAGAADAGNDTLIGGAGDDVLGGGPGNDLLVGGGFDDGTIKQISDHSGNSNLDGADTLYGADGNDIILGGGWNDGAVLDNGKFDIGEQVTSGTENNVIWAGNGHDLIYGGAGHDLIGARDGNDTVHAGGGNDTVYGGASVNSDQIFGEDGNDLLYSGAGNDIVDGGAGNDQIVDGLGDDVYTGGAGADLFQFANDAGTDRITDFNISEDSLNLTDVAASFTSADAVKAAATAQNGGVSIDLGDGHSLVLDSVSLSDIGSMNFIF